MKKLFLVIIIVSLCSTAFSFNVINAATSKLANSTASPSVATPAPKIKLSATAVKSVKLPVFTLAQLAKFNGKNGSKVYVGYKGFVYDATKSGVFKNGVHIYDSNVKAGTDLTTLFAKAPGSHKQGNYIEKLPKVGVLSGTITATPTPTPSGTASNGSTLPVFTLVQLAKFDGVNDPKIYVGYNGFVYDATKSGVFKNGVHIYSSKVKAGTDITTQFQSAPGSHSRGNYIESLPKVGILQGGKVAPSGTAAGNKGEYENEDDDD